MRTSMWLRAAFGAGVALLALALTGVTAAVAAAAPAVIPVGKSMGYATVHPSSTSATSIVVTVVAALITLGVIAYAALALDRRSRVQLRAVEGPGASGETPSAQADDERRKAA